MKTPSDFWRRLHYFINRDNATRDLEEEVRLHLEMRAEQIGSHGARRRFGNTTSVLQRSRDMWGFGRLEDFTNDLRFALRRLKQRPGFACAVVGVMAIGIGATTAMFSAVDAALLRPLPFRSPEQLVVLPVEIPYEQRRAQDLAYGRGLEFADAAEMRETFSDVSAYGTGTLDLNDPDNPQHLNVGVVSANLFEMLGVRPVVGRAFHVAEGKPPAPQLVLLSHAFWQRQYGSRDVVGLNISLDGRTFQVVGVMPRGFSFPREPDLWLPMSIPKTPETMFPFKDEFSLTVVARLADGIDANGASARLLARWMQLRESRLKDATKPDDYVIRDLKENGLPGLRDVMVGDKRKALVVLLAATGLLLLVACVNVTNLLLAHGSQRAGEIAVRLVLGASQFRVMRQLLTESVVLSLGGAALGTLIAPVSFKLLAVLMPESMRGLTDTQIDVRVLLFAIALALVTGIAFGIWPAIGGVRRDFGTVIKGGGGHGSTGARSSHARRMLVGAELALTTTLLIGAVLMLQSFRELMSRETGMRTEQTATLRLSFPPTRTLPTENTRKMEAILHRFAEMPDVSAAGFVNNLPLAHNDIGAMRMRVVGGPVVNSKLAEETMTRTIIATGGYFPAMGIKLLRGRLFTEADDANAPRTAVINERMARTYWPDRDAVGQSFYRGTRDTIPYTVIGIVGDVREMQLEARPMMQVYWSAHAITPTAVSLVVRSALPPVVLFARMNAAVRAVDKTQAVYQARMMDDVRDSSVAPRKTNTLLIAIFAGLALVLASVGIYAVVSHTVSHRSRELGIRSALGANGTHLMQMISLEMASVTVFGITTGVAVAWALGKTIESLLYGVTAHDTTTFIAVPFALLVPVLIATIIPAGRVLRVDPAQVMRAN